MQITKSRRHLVILTGGGTGGHVFPLLAVARELKLLNSDIELEYYGSGAELEKKFAANEGIGYKRILCGRFRRYFTLASLFQNIGDLFLTIFGIFQAGYLIFNRKPTVVFSKGGFVSIPTVLAAAINKVPVILHESDIMPGLANRLAMHFARRLAVAFPLTAYSKNIRFRAFYAGLPLREEFSKCYDKLPSSGSYILVVGGSSGASDLNQLVFNNAKDLLAIQPIVHLTGENDYKEALKFKDCLSKEIREKYTVVGFSDNMPSLISGASIVVSRAGATSIFEIAACRKKALLVPIRKDVAPHQHRNADYFASNGLAQIYEHTEPNNVFVSKVKKTLSENIPDGIREIYFPDSAKVLAGAISEEIERADFKKIRNVFLIGISGVSMKGIGQMLRQLGKYVKGSDLKISGHSKENITKDLDLVVYSSAAGDDTVAKIEHEEAHRFGIPIIKRPQAIAQLMNGHTGISISGMHGKTTISTLTARIFDRAVRGPSYLIGAETTKDNPTERLGKGEHFIAEACEYDDAFLVLPTTIGLISNIEEEHLDFFKGGLPEIKKHFESFIRNIHPGGCLVFCADDLNSYDVVRENFDLLKSKRIEILSYGFKPSADLSIVKYDSDGEKIQFDIMFNKRKTHFESHVFGKHFALNCAGAMAISMHFGIPAETVRSVVLEFKGASRRFALVGQRRAIKVFDDYAHHPTEISATLAALQDIKSAGKKIVIFQPHQQKRLNALFVKFVSAFLKSKENSLLVLPVYKVPGRDENEKETHTSQELVEEISKKKSRDTRFVSNFEEASNILVKEAKKGDIILTMGATDVHKIGERFLRS